MVSGGNYNDNTGPVIIKGYVRGSDEPINTGSLNTEQVNRFYDCGNYIVALAIDSKTWGYGDVYMKNSSANEWITQSRVLVENIHCYDMVEFEGEYFFCGSSIKDIAGVGELSKVSIYRSSSLVCAMSKYDFEELEVVNKHGDVLTYESSIASAEYNGENYYYSLGVPRFYEFFAFDGELYAFYYNQYSSRYDKKYDYNGLYRYDRESGRFIYDEDINDNAIIKLFSDTPQDREKIQHDFAFGDKYYFIKSGLYSTADFNSIEKVVIEGYGDFTVRDAIFRGGKAYLLASCTKSNFFENVVLETADFESFRPILHFDSDLFARSFEFCNGEFYFGLGISSEDDFDYYDISECGRIYRYRYYD